MKIKITFWSWFKVKGFRSYILAFLIIAAVDAGYIYSLPSTVYHNSVLVAILVGLIPLATTILMGVHMHKTYKNYKKWSQ